MADSFLDLFDPDPGEARRKFDQLRRKLIYYFQRRGAREPEDRAQDVLRRVFVRLFEIGETHDDIVKYCFGVARNILLEISRERLMEQLPPDTDREKQPPSGGTTTPEQKLLVEERSRRIREVLNSLEADDLETLCVWDLEEKAARKDLANQLGVTAGALRGRIFKIKGKLRKRLEKAVSDRDSEMFLAKISLSHRERKKDGNRA